MRVHVSLLFNLAKKKCLTIRTTSFEKANNSGGSASIESKDVPETQSRKSGFVKNELTVSDRPELTAADIVFLAEEVCKMVRILPC